MNREIRFRAWDEKNKQMVDNFWIASMSGLPFWTTKHEPALETKIAPISSKFTVMQYTGLKDKKGKEIWESDIIADEYGAEEVIFDGGGFKINETYFSEMRQDEDILLGFEIIGNIYENSNLLK